MNNYIYFYMVTRKEIEKYKKYILKHNKKYDSPKYDDPSMIDPNDAIKLSNALKTLRKLSMELLDYLEKKVDVENGNYDKIINDINNFNILSEEEVDKALGSNSGSSDNSLKDKAKNKFKDVKPKLLNKILSLIDDGTIKTGKDLDKIEINKKPKKQPEPKEEVVSVKKVGRPRKNPIPIEPKVKKPRGRPSAKPKEEPKAVNVVRSRGRPKKVVTKEEIKEKEKQAKEKQQKKEAKLKKNLRPYYKVGLVPKYHRRATMEEAVKNKQVMFWGINKVDPKLIAGKSKMFLKDLQEKKSNLMVKKAGRIANFNKIKKEIELAKLKGTPIKELAEKFEAQRQELIEMQNEMKTLEEEIKKMDKD